MTLSSDPILILNHEYAEERANRVSRTSFASAGIGKRSISRLRDSPSGHGVSLRNRATPESYFHCRHIDTERGPISKWMGGARGRGRRGACANIAEHSLLIHHALSETSPEGHDIIEMREKEGTKKDGEAELKRTEAV